MEYIFDTLFLWTGRLVFIGTILMALAFLGTGVANLSLFIIKLFKGNNINAA